MKLNNKQNTEVLKMLQKRMDGKITLHYGTDNGYSLVTDGYIIHIIPENLLYIRMDNEYVHHSDLLKFDHFGISLYRPENIEPLKLDQIELIPDKISGKNIKAFRTIKDGLYINIDQLKLYDLDDIALYPAEKTFGMYVGYYGTSPVLAVMCFRKGSV